VELCLNLVAEYLWEAGYHRIKKQRKSEVQLAFPAYDNQIDWEMISTLRSYVNAINPFSNHLEKQEFRQHISLKNRAQSRLTAGNLLTASKSDGIAIWGSFSAE
jgi:hypothetical protein